MATQPSDALYKKVRDVGRAGRATAFGAGTGLVPTFSSYQKGGPEAAAATANRFIPQPRARLNIAATVAAKKDIVDSIADFVGKQQTSSIKLYDKLKAQDELIGKILGFAGTAFGAKASATASTVNSFNELTGKLNANVTNAIMDSIKATNPSAAGGIQRSFEEFVAALGSEGLRSPNLSENLNRTLAQYRMANDGPAADALMAMLEGYAATKGVSIPEVLAGQAQAAGPASPAAQALDQVNALGDTYKQIASEGVNFVMADKAAALRDRKMYSPDLAQAAEFATSLIDKLGAGATPEDAASLFDEAVKKMPGYAEAGSPVDNYLKLIDQLDTDNLPPGGTLYEARQRLFEDPAFKAWMQENNLTDPGLALKEMRRLFQAKKHQQKQETRHEMRLRAVEGVSPTTGKETAGVPSGAADLAGSPGASPATPTGGDSDVTYVVDDTGVPWFYGEDGKLRPPTPEELDSLDKQIAAAEDPDAAFNALVAPATRFHELQKAQGRAAFAAAKEKAGPALGRVQQAARDTKIHGPGFRETVSDVTFAASHPTKSISSVARSASDLIRGELDKRKQKKADTATVNALTDQLDLEAP